MGVYVRTLVVCLLAFVVPASAALADGANTFRIAIMGDNRGNLKGGDNETVYDDGGVNVPVLTDLGEALRNENVDFVIHLGDMVSKWKAKYLTDLFQKAETLLGPELDLWVETWNEASGNLRLYPVRGNHEATIRTVKDLDGSIQEDPAVVAEVWKSHFPDLPQNGPDGAEGLSYWFKYKNSLFVMDDHYAITGDPAEPMVDQAWHEEIFSRNNKLNTFIIGHTPYFPSTDSELPDIHKALPSPGGELDTTAQAARDAAWDSYGEENVQMVFAAHEHLYARGLVPDGKGNEIRQVIVGAGGAPLDPDPQLLYVENYDLTGYDPSSYDPEDPTTLPPLLDEPPVIAEADDIAARFGYLVVEVAGVNLSAEYKARYFSDAGEPLGEGYEIVDSWTLRGAPKAVPEPASLIMLGGLVATIGIAIGLRRVRGRSRPTG